ncbi:hypothetical protein GCM10025867_15430 [Frondihabitans sucicola]|uniref:D-alanyl-D-alanine carboxypeptidase-like core domain-containing protein n=1 Tax=Frondihabitans sucicola TaxID=1268041 RepID=A0ABM8GLL4_9MICO|nr:M15 family metallopeptidase [Frondihabitans sucicola]BDZ49302.1 hypothetical protein GCM10025867_15430 [Frondihabitans sucicola]
MITSTPTTTPSGASDRSGAGSGTRSARGRLAVAAIAAAASLALVLGASATPADAASKSWGGYPNGKIPLTSLSKVSNGWLRPDAATAYNSLASAFKTKFKKPLSVTEGYRTYDTQKSIFTSRYTAHSTPQKKDVEWAGKYWVQKPHTSVAAVPGTSVHGWALAVDFGANVNKAGSTEKKWADANGPKYGWYPIGNTFGEPWHFEFTPIAKKKK